MSKGKNRRRADSDAPSRSLKQTAQRHGRSVLRTLATLTVLVGLGAGAKWGTEWALTTPSLAVRRVGFSGLVRATEADLLRISGLALGQNLLGLDLRSMEKAISAHPWVKTAKVTRRLPSAVSIEVVEHRPAALVSLDELYLLDDAGEPFKKVQAQDALDLPLVTGFSREEYVERSEASAAQFRRALEVVKVYAEAGLGKVSEVRLAGREVTLVTSAGVEVRLGEAEPAAQLKRLAQVSGELHKRGLIAAVIHLDNRTRPGWVTVSPRQEDVQASTARSERTGGSSR